jgi:P4 family phage/plasmid primase-like protien
VIIFIGTDKGTGRNVDEKWHEFLERFKAPKIGTKDSAGWYVAGGFKGRRRKGEDLISRTMVVIDIDHGETDTCEAVTGALRREGLAGVVHSTYSHEPLLGDYKYRLIVPLAKPVDKAAYKAAAEGLISLLDIKGVDPASLKANQFMYFPAVRDKYAADSVYEVSILGGDGFEPSGSFSEVAAAPLHSGGAEGGAILEGTRNNHMSAFAFKVLKLKGDTEEARTAFDEEALKCVPLMEAKALDAIYRAARRAHEKKTLSDPSYIPPDEYAALEFAGRLMPRDFSDVGEAAVFVREYSGSIAYTEATKFLVYEGGVWRESQTLSRSPLHDLTGRQLKEAKKWVNETEGLLKKDLMKTQALAYYKFVKAVRNSGKINGVLKEAASMLYKEADKLDSDPYLLNTPDGTVNVKSGETQPHNATDLITKMAAVSPGEAGRAEWEDFLKTITCGDAALEKDLQTVAGMGCIGKVLSEQLIIAEGGGKNGKSTLFNALSKVLGSYAGAISAAGFTTRGGQGAFWEKAELRGKRFVVAPELEEGARLDTATVKALCSTDPITAARKHCHPFVFNPSHTIVLYTNHLPRVSGLDEGTWRRLAVIPFRAVIGDGKQVQNYADVLVGRSGGAILSWALEGARLYLEAGGKIKFSEATTEATKAFRGTNDWRALFIAECLMVDEGYIKKEKPEGEAHREQAGRVFDAYRQFAQGEGFYALPQKDFNAALGAAGFKHGRKKDGRFWWGLKLNEKWQKEVWG